MIRGRCDIAIVGGGLAGGLIAAALRRERPDLSLRLIESGDKLGGNHRWSWFASDLDPAGKALMDIFPQARWQDGYEVRFPRFERRLRTSYHSLASSDFHDALAQLLPPEAVLCGRAVASLDGEGVTLEDSGRIAAGAVIDCRGQSLSPCLEGGWQVFYGRHLRTSRPHGLTRPIIMDCKLPQHDAYRFVYVLPLTSDQIFVEDTYYADQPALDRPELEARVSRYCARHGWEGEILQEETGVLPVITGGDFDAFTAEQRVEGVARAGAAGGFVHPLTSYTLPLAVQTALAIAGCGELSGPALARRMEARAREHWRATRFYRLLGRMLFGAAEPEQRFRIFQRFYGLPEGLIERFYAARSTPLDRLRILTGKPPVPLRNAWRALHSRGAPLVVQSMGAAA